MTGEPINILLVEDAPLDAQLLRELLAQAQGVPFVLAYADQLATGLARLAAGGIDIILLDLSLPDAHGLDTFIKVHAHAAGVPIIVLTGSDNETLAMQALQAGAQDYLVKGQLDGNILVRSIRYAIERARTLAALQHSEEALREANQTLQALIEAAPLVITALDRAGNVTIWNPAAKRMFGWSAHEVLGGPLPIVPADKQADFAALCQIVLQGRSFTSVEARRQAKDGSAIDVSTSIAPLRDASDNVTGIIAVLTDITERKWSEAALRESEERFRSIFEETPIGMVLFDPDHRLLKVNKVFCEMLGYTEQELVEGTVSVITHPEDISKDADLAEQVSTGVIASYRIEKRYIKKNRELLWAEVTATTIRDRNGTIRYQLAMIENIIERKRAELLEEERRHLAYELHDGVAQVAASVHQHLQTFAHHYRPRSPRARQDLDRAAELAQLVVREARRIIAGLRPTALDDFGLATALRMQVESLRADGWEIFYEEALGTERLPPPMETALFRVAQEALTNVRKHAHTTRARLALRRQRTAICLEVQDWGDGFHPLSLPNRVNPGERVGLRGMQDRIALLGGHFAIRSQPGAGTLVRAEIPVLGLDEEVFHAT
ncbi:MAG TPA: PAS domain S-box protein [Roseiflexaceae bacterium]|jgi:PAS domain S-box-containing protein